jgi:hypothetical protein
MSEVTDIRHLDAIVIAVSLDIFLHYIFQD